MMGLKRVDAIMVGLMAATSMREPGPARYSRASGYGTAAQTAHGTAAKRKKLRKLAKASRQRNRR